MNISFPLNARAGWSSGLKHLNISDVSSRFFGAKMNFVRPASHNKDPPTVEWRIFPDGPLGGVSPPSWSWSSPPETSWSFFAASFGLLGVSAGVAGRALSHYWPFYSSFLSPGSPPLSWWRSFLAFNLLELDQICSKRHAVRLRRSNSKCLNIKIFSLRVIYIFYLS